MKLLVSIILVMAAFALAIENTAGGSNLVLITLEEADRDGAPSSELTFRAGVSRGPAITVVSPSSSEMALQSPIRLQLKFEARSGSQIDVDSIKLIYAKKSPIDLTDRIRPFVRPAGLDLPEAVVPPGTHTLRVEIKDKEGRSSSVTFTLKVAE